MKMNMPRIRVLVVEDSITVRRRLCDVLAGDAELEVVAEAEDGSQAIDLCREFRPNVITMDMMMPVMTGLAATEFIMAHFPTPILIVSSSTNRGELFKTYEALAAGAIDVLEKPTGNDDNDWDRRFIATVKLISRIKTITHPRARLSGYSRAAAAFAPSPAAHPPAGRRPSSTCSRRCQRIFPCRSCWSCTSDNLSPVPLPAGWTDKPRGRSRMRGMGRLLPPPLAR
jgi:two-component system chemotaxis response regulator CheB